MRADSLARAHQQPETEPGLLSAVTALLSRVAANDPDIRAHSQSVARLAVQVGQCFGLDAAARQELYLLGTLHDVGKISIEPAILRKPSPLTPAETAVVRQHPVEGAEAIARIPGLAHLCDPIRHHHERYDGMGYPDGLPGEEMDLRTHIIVACDAYDAMTCRRPYRPAMSRHRAVEELSACTGTQFHPDVVEALVTILGIEHLAAA